MTTEPMNPICNLSHCNERHDSEQGNPHPDIDISDALGHRLLWWQNYTCDRCDSIHRECQCPRCIWLKKTGGLKK